MMAAIRRSRRRTSIVLLILLWGAFGLWLAASHPAAFGLITR